MQWHLGEITTLHAVGGSGAERSSETSECHGWGECPVAARTVTHWCSLCCYCRRRPKRRCGWVCACGACVRACASCVLGAALDYQLAAGCAALGALRSSARLPCLLPPIYPSSLLKGFSFLFAAHRRAYVRIEKALHLCVQLSTNKCSAAHTSRPATARCMPRALSACSN